MQQAFEVGPQQAESKGIAGIEIRDNQALDSESDRASSERRMPVRKPSGTSRVALHDPPAFLQGKI